MYIFAPEFVASATNLKGVQSKLLGDVKDWAVVEILHVVEDEMSNRTAIGPQE
jgi:hypothetical protein